MVPRQAGPAIAVGVVFHGSGATRGVKAGHVASAPLLSVTTSADVVTAMADAFSARTEKAGAGRRRFTMRNDARSSKSALPDVELPPTAASTRIKDADSSVRLERGG